MIEVRWAPPVLVMTEVPNTYAATAARVTNGVCALIGRREGLWRVSISTIAEDQWILGVDADLSGQRWRWSASLPREDQDSEAIVKAFSRVLAESWPPPA